MSENLKPDLAEVGLKVKGVDFKMPGDQYYWQDPTMILDDQEVELLLPDEEDPESMQQGLTVRLSRGILTVDDIDNMIELLTQAKIVVGEFNSRIADRIEEAIEKEKQLEQERKEAADNRAKALQERSEMLLNELMGEKGRIRTNRSKTYQTVIVTAEEFPYGSGEYRGAFEWTHPHYDMGKPKDLERVRTFDIKVGSRYQRVWDDGPDDLMEWDRRNLKDAKPYDGSLSE